MSTILVLFILLLLAAALLFFLLLFGGITALSAIGLHKSLKEKSPAERLTDKNLLKVKLEAEKSRLVSWNDHSASDITNDLYYVANSFFSGRISGVVKSPVGKPIIAFSRLEYGIKRHSCFFASSTDWEFYFEFIGTTATIWRNDVLFGYFEHGFARDSKGIEIARLTRPFTYVHFSWKKRYYGLYFPSGHKAEFRESHHRGRFKKVRRFNSAGSLTSTRTEIHSVDLEPAYTILQSQSELTVNETQWVLALTLFEVIHYSWNFKT